MMNSERYFLVGGAGFIGGHFTDRLLGDTSVKAVTLFDNFFAETSRIWTL
jgi:nucleoside-diphosphate-sugar epimerase